MLLDVGTSWLHTTVMVGRVREMGRASKSFPSQSYLLNNRQSLNGNGTTTATTRLSIYDLLKVLLSPRMKADIVPSKWVWNIISYVGALQAKANVG